MVKTLQIKFVKTAMTAITVLLLLVICAISGIYTFNVYSEAKWTAQMLANNGGVPAFDDLKDGKRTENGENSGNTASEDWASEGWGTGEQTQDELPPEARDQDGWEPGPPAEEREGNGGLLFKKRMSPDDAMSVRFFIVSLNSENAVESTDTGRIYSVTEEEAQEYALNAAGKGRQSGIADHFFYYIAELEDTKTAAFVDISSQVSSVLSVIVISLIIAAIAWALMFIFVSALSHKAIAPIAENIVRQKQFVTNAGHELKTPLAIIMANTEALELFNGETKWTRNIKAQTKRLNGLMQNLLTLSKMDEAELNLPMQDFDLGDLIKEAAAPFEEPAREKKLGYQVESPAIKVNANRDSIGQLLGILLDNAVKYTPEGGRISVTAFEEGKYAVLRQQNTIDPSDIEEDPEKLFDRFYRRDGARTQKKGGYGIGLSAARAIASANKAQISVSYKGQESIVFDVRLML